MKDYLSSVMRSFALALGAAALGALSIVLMLALYDMPRTVEMDVMLWSGVLLALAFVSELLARRGVSMLLYLITSCLILYFGGEQVVARTAFIPASGGFPIYLRMCLWTSGGVCAYACHKAPGSNAFVRLSDTLIFSAAGYMATVYAIHDPLDIPVLAFSLAALLLSMLVTASLRAGGESDSVIRGTGMGGYLVIGALLGVCLLLAALLLSVSSGHITGIVEAFLLVWGFITRIANRALTILAMGLAYLFGGQRMMQRQHAAQEDSFAYSVGPMEETQLAPQWVVYLIMGVIAALILAAVIGILWALRCTKFGRTQRQKIRRRITRTSKAGEAIRALIRKIAALIAFELHYRARWHTPQGLYVFAVRSCRTKRIAKRKHESPGAYMRRLHSMLLAQGAASNLDCLADLLDCAFYGDNQPPLSRAQADVFAAQIRSIAAPPLIKTAKDR